MVPSSEDNKLIDMFVDELATAFHIRGLALELLRRAGFPRALTPMDGLPIVFWSTVVEMVQNGALPGGVRVLAKHAKAFLPSNEIFSFLSVSRPGICRRPMPQNNSLDARELGSETSAELAPPTVPASRPSTEPTPHASPDPQPYATTTALPIQRRFAIALRRLEAATQHAKPAGLAIAITEQKRRMAAFAKPAGLAVAITEQERRMAAFAKPAGLAIASQNPLFKAASQNPLFRL